MPILTFVHAVLLFSIYAVPAILLFHNYYKIKVSFLFFLGIFYSLFGFLKYYDFIIRYIGSVQLGLRFDFKLRIINMFVYDPTYMIAFFFFILYAYSLVRYEFPKLAITIYVGLSLLLLILQVYTIIVVYKTEIYAPLLITDLLFFAVSMVFILIIGIRFVWETFQTKHRGYREALIFTFGFCFILIALGFVEVFGLIIFRNDDILSYYLIQLMTVPLVLGLTRYARTSTSMFSNTIKQLAVKMHLTKREVEIVNAILRGKTNQKIANDFYISKRTVEKHMSNVYEKLNVTNRIQLFNICQGED